MNFHTLISQYDMHSEINVLLIEKFKIEKLIFIISNEDSKKMKEITKLYEKLIPNCRVMFCRIKKGDSEGIRKILLENKEALVNLSGGERINSLLLLKIASELNINSIFVDLIEQNRYVFADNYRVIKRGLQDMTIEDIINLSGASLIDDSSYLTTHDELIDIAKIILNNLDIWYKYKQKLYDNKIFTHDYKDSFKVEINIESFQDEEKLILKKCLEYLEKIGGINYRQHGNIISVEFKNNYLKAFIFKSGTWLEVLTHKIIESIKEVDEVKSGLLFRWSTNSKEVQNELDVIAIMDSVLICISCKDSEKYDEDALNELQVYSEKIGGNKVIKILVSTKKAAKLTIANRAKEMGINIVVLDKDIYKFKKIMEGIIKK